MSLTVKYISVDCVETQNMERLDFYLILEELMTLSANGSWLGLNNVAQ